MKKLAFTSLVALAIACGGAEASAPPHLDLPVPPVRTSGASGNKGREAPPGSLASEPSPFPAIARAQLDEALALLGQIVSEPRFDGTELRKLKARRADEAREAARGSGAWSATRVMFRELYAEQNPYSHYDMVPSEIAKVTEATLRDFH